MLIGEEQIYLGRTQRLVLASDDLVEVDESDLFGLRHLFGPAGVLITRNSSVPPDFSRDGRADDWRRAFGPRVGDIFSQVPAIAMNDFVFFGKQVVNLFRLFAQAFDRAARARCVVDRAAVV